MRPDNYDPMTEPVETLAGVGPARAARLHTLRIRTVRDLLWHLPRAYDDRTRTCRIAEAQLGEEVSIEAEVTRSTNRRLRGRMSMAVLELRDDSGSMGATFFGRGFLAATLKPGLRLRMWGKVERYQGLCLKNPEYEVIESGPDAALHTGRVVPLYPLTEKLTQRMLRGWIHAALAAMTQVRDPLPPALRARYGFPGLAEALRAIHFPPSLEATARLRDRFVYEELLAMQLAVQRGRRALEVHGGEPARLDGPILAAVRAQLDFSLTGAQERVVAEVLRDMASPRPMSRLVQGDVGCGKTIVAVLAAAAAVDSGGQVALMAPTEVLAEQQYRTLERQLAPCGVEVALLTGALRRANAVRGNIAAGKVDVVVGTQALFQNATAFARLRLVIVDEQHRFGVAQRERLRRKGRSVDLLQLSATPIPRSLALTLYGGLDVSVIDELPPGRLPVKTRRIPAAKTDDLYAYVAREAAEGRQAYVICPVVEESETKALTSVIDHFEALCCGALAGVPCALLHGRMDPSEKEATLGAFRRGEVAVLFSTTVVEVGVDVPNATTLVIEDAPQFGLTQLHQLRGRVGRGNTQAYCFLLGKGTTDTGEERMRILCKCNDGFEIAEADLRMRGPGEFFGARQAGLADLRVADLVRDVLWIGRAQHDAAALLEEDPKLKKVEHQHLAAQAGQFEGLCNT